MKVIVINNSQLIPVKNIDTVYINTEDKTKMSIYTVGGFTVTNHYPTEEDCRNELSAINKILNDYYE